MDKQLAADMAPEARIQFLEDNCHGVEEMGYVRRFSGQEITQLKDELSHVVIMIEDIDAEKKQAMDDFKDRLKEPMEDRKELVSKIRNKSEFVRQKCYKFIDEQSRTVGHYSPDGELIETRPMRPEEMQTNIFQFKTGTDN